PVVGSRLEREAPAHSVHDDLLKQLEPRFLVVDDLRRLGVQGAALARIEGVARLLHQIVKALARLATGPVLSVEPVRMPEPPETAVRVEQGRLRIAQEQTVRRNGALV